MLDPSLLPALVVQQVGADESVLEVSANLNHSLIVTTASSHCSYHFVLQRKAVSTALCLCSFATLKCK